MGESNRVPVISSPVPVWLGGFLAQPPAQGWAIWCPDRPGWTILNSVGVAVAATTAIDFNQQPLPGDVFWAREEAAEATLRYIEAQLKHWNELRLATQGGMEGRRNG